MTRLLLLVLLLSISVWFISPVIQFGQVDPLALVVGVVAIWFVWQETRRNNTPIVQVLECQGSEVYEIGGRFQQFRVLLHNRGISLWNVTVTVCFNHGSHGHTCAYELPPKKHTNGDNAGEFARGMQAEYELTLKKPLSPFALAMRDSLLKLENAGKQKAKICVYSQGYLAYSIPIGSFVDRTKGRWNQFAGKINGRFEKTVERPGMCPLLIAPKYVPTFLTLEDKLTYFVWALKQDSQREREGSAGQTNGTPAAV